eukprot:767379-Hanusia_phi.AAC.2
MTVPGPGSLALCHPPIGRPTVPGQCSSRVMAWHSDPREPVACRGSDPMMARSFREGRSRH